MTSIPRILIAGTHSGCGKTTVATGLMAALVARGLLVQPFKVGPDFIDPTHHTSICGRASRNLDPFMMGDSGVTDTFLHACTGADIAVIEGVMGFFDGIDGSDHSSTAHVARLLKAPVLLVADIRGMSRSVHALIKGYREYDPSLPLAGVIFNQVGSPRHRQMIEPGLNLPSYGWIPRREDLKVQSRHLGLVMAHESGSMAAFGAVIKESCDLDAIVTSAKTAPALPEPEPIETPPPASRAAIGVAMDEAFCFYYQDNLDLLKRSGADPIFFSPLADRLPDVDGIYLGGGYPELHLPALESARCMRELKAAADAGLPVYAECGGLIALTEEIAADRTYRLCGVLPATTEMTHQVAALGYVDGRSVAGSGMFPAGVVFKGHEFHYSKVLPARDARFAFTLSRGAGIERGRDGLCAASTVGAYMHAYFTPQFAGALFDAAVQYSRR
jgi:cobyrinic acid a,c-diamide synthase